MFSLGQRVGRLGYGADASPGVITLVPQESLVTNVVTTFLNVETRWTLSITNRMLLQGSGRVRVFDTPSALVDTNSSGSLVVGSGINIEVVDRVSLVGNQRATILNTGRVAVFSVGAPTSRLVLAGRG